jgi:hypothetical protein
MEPGIELVVRVLVGGAAIRPSVGAPPHVLLPESGFSDQCADDLVEGLGLAGLVAQAGAPADQDTADDGGRAARNVYLRQDAFDAQVNTWLATAFAPAHLSNPIDQIMAGQEVHADRTAAQAATAKIEDASVKMARYRAALDAGGDPEEIGTWISEAKAQRLAAEAELRRATPPAALSREQVQAVIEQCADLAKDLRDAEPADMAGAYRKLGPRPANIGKWLVSEGGLEPPQAGARRHTSACTRDRPDLAFRPDDHSRDTPGCVRMHRHQ